MAATRLGTTRPCRITSLAVAATATPLGRKDQGGTAGLLHWAIGRCQIRLLWQPATESVHPPGAPDLLALAERLRQRRLHHRARDRVPAHLEDRPDQALDPEAGVPEAVSHHHHSSFEVSRPGDEKIHFVSLLFAPDAGDRGPWVSLPLRATIPEGNTVGQQRRRRPIASRAGAEGAGADRGHRRIDAGDIDAGETWGT